MQGVSSFKFEVIQMLYDDADPDIIEDGYIDKFDCIHPLGYNLRMNRLIESNGDDIDLNAFEIEAKHVFCKDNKHVFSIGEFSKSRSYQTLINIKENTDTTQIQKKKMFKFRYLEIVTESERVYDVGSIYTLKLKYRFSDDAFVIL
jgi:hypothetical protein